MEPPWEGGKKIYTKWSMSHVKDGRHANINKIFSSRTRSPMILKLDMLHQSLKLYKFYINDGSGLTLAYFMVRSNRVACTFELGNVKKLYKGENLQQSTKLTE